MSERVIYLISAEDSAGIHNPLEADCNYERAYVRARDYALQDAKALNTPDVYEVRLVERPDSGEVEVQVRRGEAARWDRSAMYYVKSLTLHENAIDALAELGAKQ